MGYFDFAQYGPTGTSSDVLRKTLEDNFYPTYEGTTSTFSTPALR